MDLDERKLREACSRAYDAHGAPQAGGIDLRTASFERDDAGQPRLYFATAETCGYMYLWDVLRPDADEAVERWGGVAVCWL